MNSSNINSNGKESKNEDLSNSKKLIKEEKKRLKQEKFMKKTKKDAPIASKKPVSFVEEKVIYTPIGHLDQKKDTKCPLPEKYHPTYVEATWNSWWHSQKFFDPEYRKTVEEIKKCSIDKKFITIMPPPNVTGTLHIGHALMCAIEDTMTRWNRMRGKLVLWNPGCDHAGIATQVVVEKKLKNESNVSRHDIGREKFLEEVWKWKKSKESIIVDQLNKLGVSSDWSRSFFTMDEPRSKAVFTAFNCLHNKGLIYRAKRLVNWSCSLKSAISDIEVDNIEINNRQLLTVPGYDYKIEFGVLIEFSYQVENSDEKITVSTTRVETMLGDTAVAVHPDDSRYQHLVGKMLIHPFCPRKLKVISDLYVDMNFGTGAVKITPAHDHNDYEIGKRYDLDMINIFDDSGLVSQDLEFFDQYQHFKNMKRFDLRKIIVDELKKLSLFVDKKDNSYVVPFCSRSKDVIEPILKSQWYVSCSEMAKKAINLVKKGELKIFPTHHERTWFSWMENIQDWCISRQLWWGHRIPAYYVTSPMLPNSNPDDEFYWVSALSYKEALLYAESKYNIPCLQLKLTQDEDVLDTWFSSGLLPFSTFNWPDKSPEFDAFYPINVLETGYDILFFWVARMVMLSVEIIGTCPFSQIVLHPIVRDSHGRKMSKSLGNIIDPVDVINGITLEGLQHKLLTYNLSDSELKKAKQGQGKDFPNGIPECGSDALRFTLCAYSSSKKDINLDILRAQGYRFFCNKIWNAVRFCLSKINNSFTYNSIDHSKTSLIDNWILSRLSFAESTSNSFLESYEFASYTTSVYNFWWYDLCDIYIEAIKPILASENEEFIQNTLQVLVTCIDNGLRLLSPIMPFITEELYQRLPFPPSHFEKTPSICVSEFPFNLNFRDENIEESFNTVLLLINSIRSFKDQYVSTKTKLNVYIDCHSNATFELFKRFYDVIKTLTFSQDVFLTTDISSIPSGCVITPNNQFSIHLLLKGVIDIGKEISKTKDLITQSTTKLNSLNEITNSKDYQKKVPDTVKRTNDSKRSIIELEIQRLNQILQCLEIAE